ncbi:DUF4198 domain-containing protein [Halarsenatibacter silvermanii]|uniref:Uncharacterized conserved protein, contains GH25 family domain n=1 Tax=Halarsenatibacter silvermanii TaxID=321763 RepID=A0A1G9QL80_9FIRM|nr:DUF4198 domain-containing protein [Halarsenatibacter silvermanii]SDM11783.1 Uncharacterized conserved protein, contains GH25 family domain [Halarsenatibacter silvermanii]
MLKKLAIVLTISVIILTFNFLGIAEEIQAHEIILDFPQQIEVEEEVDIEISFGHFPEMYDYEHSFFAELENGELKVIKPDGSEKELGFTREMEEAYSAAFTPSEAGIYWLTFTSKRPVVDRTDDGDGKQLRYYDAKAPLKVSADEEDLAVPETDLAVEVVSAGNIQNNAGEEITLQVLYEGEPAADQSLSVVSPLEEVQTYTTDEKGEFVFTPEEEGVWFIHVSNLTDTEKEGEFGGEDYDRIRYNSAFYMEIEEEEGWLF